MKEDLKELVTKFNENPTKQVRKFFYELLINVPTHA